MAMIPITRPSRRPDEHPRAILAPRVHGKDARREGNTICIDSLRVFSESKAILQLFGARRLSQQSYSSFPEPPRGAYPYIRGHYWSVLFLTLSADCGHRGSHIHCGKWK